MNRPAAMLAVGTVLFALYTLAVGDFETINREQTVYATLIVVLGLVPVFGSVLNRQEGRLIPLMPLHGMYYGLAYGLPVFSSLTEWSITETEISEALVFTILGMLCLYGGYYASRPWFSKLQHFNIAPDVPPREQALIGWLFYAFHMLLVFVPEFRGLPSVGQLTEPLSYLATGLLFTLALKGQVSVAQVLPIAGALTFVLITKLVSGSLAGPVLYLLFLGVLYWVHRRTVPWPFVIVSITIALGLNPVKGTYRNLAWHESSLSFSEKILAFYESATDFYIGASALSVITEDRTTINRLAVGPLLGYVMSMTPGTVPYWMGGSYKTLWTSFIPRILWPDKPQAQIGQEFGQRYGLLGPTDETTSVNLPWLPEFYANFGTSGVIVGMFFVGALFRFLAHRFSAPPDSNVDHVFGVSMTFSLFYAESNFSLMFGGVFLSSLFFVVLLRRLTNRRLPITLRRPPAP